MCLLGDVFDDTNMFRELLVGMGVGVVVVICCVSRV